MKIQSIQYSDIILYTFTLICIFATLYIIFKMIYNYYKLQKRIYSSDDNEYMNEVKEEYIKTNGHFTGNRRFSFIKTKTGYKNADFYEYEIIFFAEDKEISVWYKFYPAPDPENNIDRIKVYLQYNPKKPHDYELLDYYLEEI